MNTYNHPKAQELEKKAKELESEIRDHSGRKTLSTRLTNNNVSEKRSDRLEQKREHVKRLIVGADIIEDTYKIPFIGKTISYVVHYYFKRR